jgi:hypothetical protein
MSAAGEAEDAFVCGAKPRPEGRVAARLRAPDTLRAAHREQRKEGA